MISTCDEGETQHMNTNSFLGVFRLPSDRFEKLADRG